MQPRGPLGWIAGQASGDDYEAHFERRASGGADIHGEAAFVASFAPRSVLDAGCGTGRVARELARRGIDCVGVDLDPAMLETAQKKAPQLDWRVADLVDMNLGRIFDVVVLAGNVMIFVVPGTEAAIIKNLAGHLSDNGLLIAGFQLGFSLTLEQYDCIAGAAGLVLVERWSTWDRDKWHPSHTYAVSVHRKND